MAATYTIAKTNTPTTTGADNDIIDGGILPMGVACAWILWTYGDAILDKKYRVVLSAIAVAKFVRTFF